MKFATIHEADGKLTPVVDTPSGALLALQDIDSAFHSLRRLIEMGEPALAAVRRRREEAGAGTLDPAEVRFAPPVGDPSKMLFVALNNSAVDEHLRYRPDFPAYFPKLPSTLIGNGEVLELQEYHGLTHPEPELGIIIGKTARNVSLDGAMSYVFGYTVIDDVTSVGMRKEDVLVGTYPIPRGDGTFQLVDESFLYPGRYKNVDGFCPMGPFVVHASLVPSPMSLGVKAWVDDELVIQDNTRNFHYSAPEVIYWMSHHQTLYPGDIISLGTAVHPDSQAKPLSYSDLNRAGDRVRVEIESVGELVTPVRRIRGSVDPRTYFAENKRFKSVLK